jgi:5-methylcytosine-specific restriction protein A
MPWTTSNRRAELPRDWARRRVRILTRDGYRCQALDSLGAKCGEYANQVDHIERGSNHAERNLQALCQWHHARKSSAEGHAAQRPKLKRAREPEPHPGMIPSV